MAVVRLDCDRITDWESFHSMFAEVFGFPNYYGRNMNAWIDCMSSLDDPEASMTSLRVEPGGVLTLQLDAVSDFASRCPDLYSALIECAAFVNWRRSDAGDGAILALAYHKQP